MSARAAARIAWSTVALSVIVITVAGIFTALTWSTETITPRLTGASGIAQITSWFILWGTFAVVGALIVSRQPRNAIGWILLWYGLGGGVAGISDAFVLYALVTEPGSVSGGAEAAWLNILMTEVMLLPELALLFLLMPNGQLPSSRWKPVALATIVIGVLLVVGQFEPGELTYYPLEDDLEIANPFGIEPFGSTIGVVKAVAELLVIVPLVLSLVAPILRFRRAQGIERQQLKWFALAGIVVLLVWVIVPLVATGFGVSDETLNIMVLPGFFSIPIAIGIAVLRHNLYDIDVIINRTLVYAALTVSLAGAYLVSILVLGTVVRTVAGQSSSLVVAVSTLAVAALFRPLRSGIQSAIDRRFYRHKYDAARTLEMFNTRLQDEIDLDTLATELCTTVQETMQPAHLCLWLRAAPAEGRGGR